MRHRPGLLHVWTLAPALAALLGAATPDERVDFDSGVGKVHAEVFKPTGTGPSPAVVVVYGTLGMDGTIGDAIRDFAGELRANGFVAVIPDYFASTKTKPGEDALRAFSSNRDAWVEVVGDALAYADSRADVSKANVGLLGFSLGGHLVLRAGKAGGAVRPKAVVEFAGPTAQFGGIGAGLDKLPPVQVHHGEDDDIVPPGETRALDGLLTKAKVPHEVFFYPREKHVPFGPAATKLSTDRTVEAFRKELR